MSRSNIDWCLKGLQAPSVFSDGSFQPRVSSTPFSDTSFLEQEQAQSEADGDFSDTSFLRPVTVYGRVDSCGALSSQHPSSPRAFSDTSLQHQQPVQSREGSHFSDTRLSGYELLNHLSCPTRARVSNREGAFLSTNGSPEQSIRYSPNNAEISAHFHSSGPSFSQRQISHAALDVLLHRPGHKHSSSDSFLSRIGPVLSSPFSSRQVLPSTSQPACGEHRIFAQSRRYRSNCSESDANFFRDLLADRPTPNPTRLDQEQSHVQATNILGKRLRVSPDSLGDADVEDEAAARRPKRMTKKRKEVSHLELSIEQRGCRRTTTTRENLPRTPVTRLKSSREGETFFEEGQTVLPPTPPTTGRNYGGFQDRVSVSTLLPHSGNATPESDAQDDADDSGAELSSAEESSSSRMHFENDAPGLENVVEDVQVAADNEVELQILNEVAGRERAGLRDSSPELENPNVFPGSYGEPSPELVDNRFNGLGEEAEVRLRSSPSWPTTFHSSSPEDLTAADALQSIVSLVQTDPRIITEAFALFERTHSVRAPLELNKSAVQQLHNRLIQWCPEVERQEEQDEQHREHQHPEPARKKRAPNSHWFWKKLLKIKPKHFPPANDFLTTIIASPTLRILLSSPSLDIAPALPQHAPSDLINAAYFNAMVRVMARVEHAELQHLVLRVLLYLFFFVARWPNPQTWVAYSNRKMQTVDRAVGEALWNRFMALIQDRVAAEEDGAEGAESNAASSSAAFSDGDDSTLAMPRDAFLAKIATWVDFGSKYAFVAQNSSLGTLIYLLMLGHMHPRSLARCSKGGEVSGISVEAFEHLTSCGLVRKAEAEGLNRMMHQLLWDLVGRFCGVDMEPNEEGEGNGGKFPGFP